MRIYAAQSQVTTNRHRENSKHRNTAITNAKYIIWMDSHFDIYYVLTLKIKAVQFDLYLM